MGEGVGGGGGGTECAELDGGAEGVGELGLVDAVGLVLI